MNKKNLKYLALGDSYTIGESVPESERFPVQLAGELTELGYSFDTTRIIAKTGWTTDELSDALNREGPLGNYDIVTLLIGVNNQYRGRDTGNYREEFAGLLQRAAGYTGSAENVIVVSIPDWGVTPFAVNRGGDPEKIKREIDDYNRIKEEETLKAGARFVGITDISRRAAVDETLIAEDGLHPSGKMYSLWVERILPLAKTIIENE